ncbi:MAG: VCBS repeat-containing protein [bacterium]|nr:VCBS repeat-containing protein [bacterium]
MRPNLLLLLLAFLLAPVLQAQQKDMKYAWTQQYYSKLNGERALIFAREMRNSKLAFGDIDGDGDLDIFMGQANGELAYFENRGTRDKADYVLVTQQYKGIFEQRRNVRKVKVWNAIDVGERSAPFLVDIDNDGDLDLFIGSAQGNIWHFENIGNNLIPVFKLLTAKFEGIYVGHNSVPVFADVNLQRKIDLIVGTVEGKVFLFYNRGTRKKPAFNKDTPQKVAEFGLETHASPSLTDWDNDGDLDLFVGMKNGTISYFENQGDRFFPDWKLKSENYLLIDVGGESAPYFIDFDQDGDDDMVMGSSNPTVALYENREQLGRRVLWSVNTNIFNFNKLVITGHRASIATGDLDGDGDPDWIVGEKAGNLNFFRNDGNAQEPDWTLVAEELLFITGMENSAPALGDLDGDGDLDLLVGDKQGLLAYIENVGSKTEPKWELKDKTYFQIDVGSNSVPRLVDIDGDGDLDLLVGNFTGRVVLYLNKGTAKDPVFALESTRFASAKTSQNSVAALLDWNGDKYVDLIVGGEDGKLLTYISPGPDAKDQLNWDTTDKAFGQFNVDLLSHPYFTDFNGDKELDLLLGNDEGDFLLYLNGGIGSGAEDMQVVVDNSIDQKSGSLVVENVEGPIELDLTEATGEAPAEEEEQPFEAFMMEEGVQKIVAEPRFNKTPVHLVKNRLIQKSSPTFGDLDADGDLDLLIGSKSGKIYYYKNQGTDQQWNFELVSEDFLNTSDLANTTPVLYDLDQDGDLDLVVGTSLGRLRFYVNQGTTEEPNFILEKDYFKGLWLGPNAKPTVMDLNHDAILDLLVGTLNGKLTFISNESNRFVIVRRDYQKMDLGIGSTPAFADLNNDEIPDLMVGSDNGKILFYKNEAADLSGTWTLQPEIGDRISPPKGSNPVAADLDHDGDLDLVTGTDQGYVLMYRNDAIVRDTRNEEIAPLSE